MKRVGIIYRKEFLELLRDRKAVIYALIVPTIFIPLLMMGFGRLVQTLQKVERRQTIHIAATPEVQLAYREMVFQWFQESQVGLGLKTASSPLGAMVEDEQMKAYLETLPKNITENSDAFHEWALTLRNPEKGKVEEAKRMLDEQDLTTISPELQEAAQEFNDVVIKGYALIEFVDPAKQPWATLQEGVEAPCDTLPYPDFPFGCELVLAINEREIAAGLQIPETWESDLQDPMKTLEFKILYDSTIGLSNQAFTRIQSVARAVADSTRDKRLREADLPSGFLRPVRIASGGNLATASRMSFEVFGTFLPYMVIIFSFLGGLYPAVDLGAGEKERLTLETLLLSTASRFEIALAKYFVILTTSLIAAFLGVASMILSFQYVLPSEIRSLFEVQISTTQIVACALLAIPPSAMFSGLFLALSIYARSFKEAHNYIAPIQFLLIIPGLAPALPNLQMNAWLALVPLVNVSLLAKDFLKGDIRWDYYALTLLSCTVLAGLCLYYCLRKFQDERVLFRS